MKLNFSKIYTVFGLFLCLSLVFHSTSQTFAQHTSQDQQQQELNSYAPKINYTIKLKVDDPQILTPYTTDQNTIQRAFEFSQHQPFQNIYTFSSPLLLDQLKVALADAYEYLEIDHPVDTEQLNITPVNGVNPNDPAYTLDSQNLDYQWGLPKVGFPQAWTKSTGSTDVVVAVIDTGLDATHADFANTRTVTGFNFVRNQYIFTGTNSDDNGHGTLVSSIIGASTNNRKGIAGGAWQVSMMPIKALDAKGTGSSTRVAESIVWSADNGADIINLSLGGFGYIHDNTLAEAITYAYNRDVLLISAAGNDVAVTGGNLDQNAVFPVCDDNGENMILGVTASDSNDQKPSFANFGKTCIDVSAPGKRILGAINFNPETGRPSPNEYAYANGTSMAVPFVVAQAVLIKSLNPTATNKQIRDRIINTSDNIDQNNPNQCSGRSCAGLIGSGRINVFASVQNPIRSYEIKEEDLIKTSTIGTVYYISGGKKQPVTGFVYNQRFKNKPITIVDAKDLESFADGPFASPIDGTLVKQNGRPTVYYMSRGLRLPVTGQIFNLRNLKFTDVKILGDEEMESWLVGSFLAPSDGSLVKTQNNPTVYWVVSGVFHPISFNFYNLRGLNVFPLLIVSDPDIRSFPKGEPYLN